MEKSTIKCWLLSFKNMSKIKYKLITSYDLSIFFMDDLMSELIIFFISNLTLTFIIISCISCMIHMNFKRADQFKSGGVYKLIFLHFIFWNIGAAFFYNFIMHVFFGNIAAEFIGWKNSPFQLEVGFASLSFSTLGFVAVFSNLSFRAASVIGISGFLWGAAGGHIYQMISTHNFAPGNAGIIFWTDLLIPTVGWLLLWLECRMRPKDAYNISDFFNKE